jgi:hypothetical protein
MQNNEPIKSVIPSSAIFVPICVQTNSNHVTEHPGANIIISSFKLSEEGDLCDRLVVTYPDQVCINLGYITAIFQLH